MTKRLSPEHKANNLRLRNLAKLIKNRVPKHPEFDLIFCVVGIVDNYGAIHAKIVMQGDPAGAHHATHFPGRSRYKAWRWWRLNGMENSCLNEVKATDEDWDKIHDWLYRNGCLQDWEIDR